MIYDAAAGLPGVVVGGVVVGDAVVGGVVVGGGVVGGGVGLRVRVGVGVGEFCGWVGVGEGPDTVGLLCTGDVVGVLFAGSGAARPPALLPVADGAGPLVVLCGSAPVRPADRPGVGVLPALGVVPGDAE
jgi:hypothetical protein